MERNTAWHWILFSSIDIANREGGRLCSAYRREGIDIEWRRAVYRRTAAASAAGTAAGCDRRLIARIGLHQNPSETLLLWELSATSTTSRAEPVAAIHSIVYRSRVIAVDLNVPISAHFGIFNLLALLLHCHLTVLWNKCYSWLIIYYDDTSSRMNGHTVTLWAIYVKNTVFNKKNALGENCSV